MHNLVAKKAKLHLFPTARVKQCIWVTFNGSRSKSKGLLLKSGLGEVRPPPHAMAGEMAQMDFFLGRLV